MKLKSTLLILIASISYGCTSVPTLSEKEAVIAKSTPSPKEGKSAIYVYRSGIIGGALKKDIWINGKCIGESAPDVFFQEEVEGDTEHQISTESEFSPNHMNLFTKAGENYFIEQYIKIGAFVGGADLELVSTDKGKKAIQDLDLAVKGNCSSKFE